MSGGRVERFVKAARSLMLMQAALALLALALSVWAVVAVRDLAAERDRLQARVAALQAPAAAAMPDAPVSEPPLPSDLLASPSVPLIIPVPVELPPPDVNMILPPEPEPAGGSGSTEAPPVKAAEPDCAGADADQPACRPVRGRWSGGVRQRPEAPPAETPQPEAETQRPPQ